MRGVSRDAQAVERGARRQGGGGRRVAARAGHARSSPSGVSWKKTRERDGLGQHSAGQVSGSGTLLSAFSVLFFYFVLFVFI